MYLVALRLSLSSDDRLITVYHSIRYCYVTNPPLFSMRSSEGFLFP